MRATKIVLLMAALGAASFAQGDKPKESAPPPEKKFYRLDLTIKELEGAKTINSREYFMIVSTGSGLLGSLRTGTRLPYGTGEKRDYMNIGVNFDCQHVSQTAAGELSLDLTADVSSLADSDSPSPSAGYPVLRTNRWQSNVVLPLGHATIVFSSDDLASKRRMQVEVTPTAIK